MSARVYPTTDDALDAPANGMMMVEGVDLRRLPADGTTAEYGKPPGSFIAGHVEAATQGFFLELAHLPPEEVERGPGQEGREVDVPVPEELLVKMQEIGLRAVAGQLRG
jgi:hypothetical protein